MLGLLPKLGHNDDDDDDEFDCGRLIVVMEHFFGSGILLEFFAGITSLMYSYVNWCTWQI